MLRLFLQFELGKILKYFKTKTLAKGITSVLFLVVFGCVAIGIYYFFITGFRYINREAVNDIQLALTLFLYEVFLLVLSGIVIVSSLISGLFYLFRGDYNNWIISSPLYTIFPKVVLFRSVLTSMLPLLIMFVPAVLAFNKMYTIGNYGLFFILVSAVLLILLLNAATLTALLLLSSLYHFFTKKIKKLQFSFKGIVILLVTTLAVSVAFLSKKLTAIDLVQLFRAEDIEASLNVAQIGSYFSGLPTHIFAVEIVSFQAGNIPQALTHFLLLLIIAFFSVLFWLLVSPHFYPLWQKLQEGDGGNLDTTTATRTGYRFTGGQLAVLFKKELLVFSRNFKGVLWFLFLFSIWLLQIAMSLLLDNNIRKHEADMSTKIAVVQALQFIIAIYFMASFALRFVFPSFSVEKKTAWILGSAPLSFKKIFYGKYTFYVVFFVITGTLMSYINTVALNLSLVNAYYSLTLLISVVSLVVTFALSLGAIFPTTETDDPEVITTSMGGLFFTAVSLIYGTVSGWLLYVSSIHNNTSFLVLFIVLTFALSLVLLILTPIVVTKNLFGNS